jgi:hypothetical protein
MPPLADLKVIKPPQVSRSSLAASLIRLQIVDLPMAILPVTIIFMIFYCVVLPLKLLVESRTICHFPSFLHELSALDTELLSGLINGRQWKRRQNDKIKRIKNRRP